MLGREPKALCILGQHSISQHHFHSFFNLSPTGFSLQFFIIPTTEDSLLPLESTLWIQPWLLKDPFLSLSPLKPHVDLCHILCCLSSVTQLDSFQWFLILHWKKNQGSHGPLWSKEINVLALQWILMEPPGCVTCMRQRQMHRAFSIFQPDALVQSGLESGRERH